ncbi:hypothetical protein E1B28_001952 [Marasmius oreades]|uniref:PBP domain-containing protein n=1 Tax=Marasmius oreades TaxID=181124 RepID=A0A9P7V4M3_9AGAR|nr:uncharacterized protein E1B28_001952 [Marasmius oreades]KAG7100173.1 hypothetical protein E1B28_001952 [Marasmius oreades]
MKLNSDFRRPLLFLSVFLGGVIAQSSTASSPASTASATVAPQAIYNGGYQDATETLLRIANGGAGQSGMVEAFANAFIKYSVGKGSKPFSVSWILGDTTQSLGFIAAKQADIALTYSAAAENQSIASGASVKKELAFVDHFYLVGPKSNPAQLMDNDSVSDVMNKIVMSGNADVAKPPSDRPATRFLSRYDKSATNIKESELFISIGQVPWAYTYSTWYHQYPRFPLQALEAASVLSEYTLTDRGTWLSSAASVTDKLVIYQGAKNITTTTTDDKGNSAVLLNPCTAVLAATTTNKEISDSFMDWLVSKDGGQQVVKDFQKNGQQLYTPASS